MNLLEAAKNGIVTDAIKEVASTEGVDASTLLEHIAHGRCVIPLNRNRPSRFVGIGKGLRTKINASIGTSSDIIDPSAEVKKALAAQKAGADTLMELSVGGDLDSIRK